ncbi:HAD-like domain-containing protein [Obelidium mucronatum]|nr:HAD-like domain-containing protein [Obelidium mucronatum]
MTKSFVVFCDFDGTITTKDTGNVIIDACIGTEERQRLDDLILNGTSSFVDANNTMWRGVTFKTFEEAIAVCQENNVTHDPGFNRFHSILNRHNVSLKVVSAGLFPIVQLYLKEYSNIEIFANTCTIATDKEEGKPCWTINYVDDSPSGHDKGAPIRKLKSEYKSAGLSDESRPKILFIGDGVSDLTAARDADFVFAKRGKDLETYCKREGIEGVLVWDDFHFICDWLEKWLAEE